MTGHVRAGSSSDSLATAGDAGSGVAIRARDLSVAYDRTKEGGPLIAVEGLTLDIRRGEFLVLLGPSGCGKSTFLNVVSGLLAPRSGEIVVNGEPVTGPGRDRALVFQDYALLPWRTVERNVRFGLELQRRVDERTTQRVAHFIDLVGLSGFERSYPRELSGGMRQRVGLARALVTEPSILLMDEPLAAVDALTREVMQNEISEIVAETGQTVVFVTHGIDEAITLADRIVVLTDRPGRVRGILDVDLPRPRTSNEIRSLDAYVALRDRIWKLLAGTVEGAP